MSNTRALDEAISQSVNWIDIGSEGWIRRYTGICQMIPLKNFGRRWVLFTLITALKHDLSTIAVTDNWTREELDEAKAVLNFPLSMTDNASTTSISNEHSKTVTLKTVLCTFIISFLSSSIAFLFSK